MKLKPIDIGLSSKGEPFRFKVSNDEIESSDDWTEIADNNFGETEETRRELLAKTRQLAATAGHLDNVPAAADADVFLLRMLRASYDYDPENAVKLIAKYTGLMRKGPEYFKLAFEDRQQGMNIAQDLFQHRVNSSKAKK